MMSSVAYFDANATTQTFDGVFDVMRRCSRLVVGNPAGENVASQRAARELEVVRGALRRVLGAATQDALIFTSGATEANNICLMGLHHVLPAGVVFYSVEIEHSSVLNTLKRIQALGREVQFLSVTRHGRLPVEQLQRLRPGASLLTVAAVNHELGTIQDYRAIGAYCRQQRVLYHSDITQAIGKLPFSELRLDGWCDYASFSAHKFHGPYGVGALYVRDGVVMPGQLLRGGNQEYYVRPGTQNVQGACGMLYALQRVESEAYRRAYVEAGARLAEAIESGLAGAEQYYWRNGAPVVPGTYSLTLMLAPTAQQLVEWFGQRGIAVSRGAACKARVRGGSNVLSGIGLAPVMAERTLRFSVSGTELQASDYERLRAALRELLEQFRPFPR